MKRSLALGAMLLASIAALPPAASATCSAPQGSWGPFQRLTHSEEQLSAAGVLRIVALGSSSTYGTGATARDRSYPAQLAAVLRARFPGTKIEVVNAGIGGETVALNLARLDRDVLALQPDLVIWQVGTNDALQKKSADEVRAGILQGIARVRATGAEIVLMDAQYFPERPDTDALRNARRIVHEAAAVAKAAVLPRHALMRHWIESGDFTPATLLVADKIHMTDASYRCLAERVADLLPAHPTAPAQDLMASATPARSARDGAAGELR
jgi:lysophospholipase L1-like esterase